jgi:hypothetical protein
MQEMLMMEEQEHVAEKQQPQVIQIMTTEHYNLQAARSVATSEATSRSNLFISTVSITLVALALIGQISKLGTAFFVFALLLFPSLFFLGLVSLERAIQNTIEDNTCLRGINRIRHLYVEVVPQVQDYFILSTHDDPLIYIQAMGFRHAGWQLFLTAAGMIAVIDSILGGIFLGLLVSQLFGLALVLCLTVGFLAFLLLLAGLSRFLWTRFWRAQRHIKTLFPSPVDQQ